MCNYSKGVEQTGIEKGIKIGEERGIQKGIVGMIGRCKKLGVSFADTVMQIADVFDFTQERSKLEVEKYW